jgi:hypothetical protein
VSLSLIALIKAATAQRKAPPGGQNQVYIGAYISLGFSDLVKIYII